MLNGSTRRGAPITNPGREHGFTLLESLTALAILAISLSALMELYVSDVKALSAADKYVKAQHLIRNLSATKLSDPTTSIRNAHGSEGEFIWVLESEPAATATGLPQPGGPWTLQRIHLRVSWPPAQSVSISTVRMRPRSD